MAALRLLLAPSGLTGNRGALLYSEHTPFAKDTLLWRLYEHITWSTILPKANKRATIDNVPPSRNPERS
jgi:hypothetical protein